MAAVRAGQLVIDAEHAAGTFAPARCFYAGVTHDVFTGPDTSESCRRTPVGSRKTRLNRVISV